MKKLVLATAFSVAASTAFAGALSDPVVEPEIIIEDASSSISHDFLVPVIVLIAILTALAG